MKLSKSLSKNNLLVGGIVIALIIGISFLPLKNFFSLSNLTVILIQAALLSMLGIGQTVIILTGSLDLSVGSMIALSTVMFAPLLKTDLPIIIPILLIMFTGMGLGLVTGLIVTKLKIPAFIATFATNYMYRGIAWILMGNMIIYSFEPNFRFMAVGEVLSIPVIFVFTIIIAIIMHFALKRTNWGRNVYFVGSNRKAAQYSGINVDKIIVSAYMVGSIIMAFCGIIYMARLNAAEPGIGGTFALDSIAVTLIGGTSISGGRGGVIGTILGAIVISVIKNLMNFFQIPAELQLLFMGVLIVSAVFMNQKFSKKE